MKIFGRYLHHDSWQEGGDCQKSYFEVFSRVGSDWPLCKISTLSVMRVMVFADKYHIFDKNWTGRFPPGSLSSFSSVPNSLDQNLGLYFLHCGGKNFTANAAQ